jgi:hypothetical protein
MQAKLDDSAPLAPQLAKLNETRVALSNASMGVTDTQYSLILLNACPPPMRQWLPYFSHLARLPL